MAILATKTMAHAAQISASKAQLRVSGLEKLV
jgi:hypothetical protein